MDRKFKEILEKNLAKKRVILQKLRGMDEVYVLFSRCTNMPYVLCEEKNYNDQIFVFGKEEDAKKNVKERAEEDIALVIVKFEKNQFLSFYAGLYLIGANAIVADLDGESTEIMLEELITRPDDSKLARGKVRVDNPQLHLTALYYMQELRRYPAEKQKVTPELKALEEEMLSNLIKGTYIIPVQDKNKIPFMKFKNGDLYQPVFTDFTEFQKFNKEQKFRAVVIPFSDFKKVIAEQSKGFVINPMGFHLIILQGQLNKIE